MALNYSRTPVFPPHFSEDNLWSPMAWHANRGELDEWHVNRGRDRVEHCCSSSESNSKDIIDLLPSDPFGMDIQTTFTAITGWLEDLEVDYGSASQENYSSFAGWNFIWNNSLKFQPFPSNYQFNQIEKHHVGTHSCPNSSVFDEKSNIILKGNQYEEERETGAEKSEDAHHEALNFALSYLGMKDLFSVERVCKSLRSSVQDAYWLWMSIKIDQPLNERITDDLLFQLARRAKGNLQCLSLVECPKVTDEGIRRILETNPRLTKLFVPGCTRLTIEGILNNIKIHNSNKGVPGIKHLRIGRIFGVTREHFEELKLLLGPDALNRPKPRFYHRGNFYLPFDDDRAIDIEMCPRCEKFKLVYDCPSEGCRVKDNAAPQVCRACTFCIARCAQCGRCISDNEYEETFCLDLLCSDCFKQTLKC